MKSTLQNLPIYYMFVLAIPVKVARRLEAIQSRFLRGDTDERRTYQLVR